jgi:hypothetical protein
MGISAPGKSNTDKEYLKALSLYLSSSLVKYYLFFHVPEWGIFRQRRSVVTSEVRKIPTPDMTLDQAKLLADLHAELVEEEKREISRIRVEKQEYDPWVSELHASLLNRIDRAIFEIFEVPEDINVLATEFVHTKLLLDNPSKSVRRQITKAPTAKELEAYAIELRNTLDDFSMGTVFHKISITYSNDLIECVIEITNEDGPIPVSEMDVAKGNDKRSRLLADLRSNLSEQLSQWVYVQRGLRLFDWPRIHIYKSPRLIDWTPIQAMNDANDIMGEVLTSA